MLFQELRWLRSLVPILLLLSGVCSFPQVSLEQGRLHCYVCGRGAEDPCGDASSVPSAVHIKMCPKEAQGCMTVGEDNEVSRSCTDLKLSDCKRANGKLYCYCETSVCNNQSVTALKSMLLDDDPTVLPTEKATNSPNEWKMLMKNIAKSSSEGNEEILGDDEDLFAGSGDGEVRSSDSREDDDDDTKRVLLPSSTQSTPPKDDDIIKSVPLPPSTQSTPSKAAISTELPSGTTNGEEGGIRGLLPTLRPREPSRGTETKSASAMSLGLVSVAVLLWTCCRFS